MDARRVRSLRWSTRLSPRWSARLSLRWSARLSAERQRDRHRRADAALAVYGDRSTNQLHIALGDRQAEAGARRFRGEVRLGDLVERFLIHPPARIRDLDDERLRIAG